MAQQQQQPRREEFQNISRTDDRERDSDIRKNNGFGSGVASYPVTIDAYGTTGGNAPGVGGGGVDMPDYGNANATTTRYEYTAVYETTAPGFGGVNAGAGAGAGSGDQWGQEANYNGRGGAGGGGNTGRNMNMNMGRDQK